ncbi:MAG: hypothetical protein RL760_72, partial [Candidatus Eisenbacteria bacterium]
MSSAPSPTPRRVPDAFRTLHRRLVRRRLATWDARLGVALVALCGSVGGFLALQLRLMFDHALHQGGVARTLPILALAWGAVLVLVAALTAERMRARLASPPGPEWLALPVPPRSLARHLEREARLPAVWLFVPAAAVVFAAWGRVPTAIGIACALAFPFAWWAVVRLVCTVVIARSAAGTPRVAEDAITRVLCAVRSGARSMRIPCATFHAGPRWRALARLDVRLTARSNALRAQLQAGVVALLVGATAWRASGRPALELQAIAFGAFLVACSQWGAWAALRAAGDPPATLRPLPLTLADRWRARAALLSIAVAASLLLPVLFAPAAPWA